MLLDYKTQHTHNDYNTSLVYLLLDHVVADYVLHMLLDRSKRSEKIDHSYNSTATDASPISPPFLSSLGWTFWAARRLEVPSTCPVFSRAIATSRQATRRFPSSPAPAPG
jgi:hypothetical protein